MTNPSSGDVFSGNFAGPVFTSDVDNRRGAITGGHLEIGLQDIADSLTQLLEELRAELLALPPDTPNRQAALSTMNELAQQLDPAAPQQPERKTVVGYLFDKLKDLLGPLRVGTELLTKITDLITTWRSGTP